MAFHLICVHPFQHAVTYKRYEKGDKITDAAEVAMLQDDREHHFVRIAAPDEPVVADVPVAEDTAPVSKRASK